VAIASSSAPGQPLALDPTRFTRCVAQTAPPTLLGPSPADEARLRAQCRQRYRSARAQVMTFLIGARWTEGEAKAEGISLSRADVQQTLKRDVAEQFPGAAAGVADLQGLLRRTGMSQSDLLLRVRTNALSAKLRDRAQAGDDAVPAAAVAAYYHSHVKQFDLPERRDVSVIAVGSAAQAQRAAAQLRSGQSFETVGRSLPRTGANAPEGVLRGLQRGHHDPAFDRAVFGAAVGEVAGPVRTTRGYYVVRAEKVLPAGQQGVREATPAIQRTLVDAVHRKRLDAFNAFYQTKWRAVTQCARELMVAGCGGVLGG
jgi:parvulin-like peptidyl-prolyl isomerase